MKLRENRIAQMKVEHELMLANKRKGHGELTEIVQDEFLPTVMGSKVRLVPRATATITHYNEHIWV